MIRIDETRCDGCGLCVEACPTGAIRLVEGVARVEQGVCRGCEVCLEACPNGAISVVREPVEVIQPVPVHTPSPTPARPAPVATRPAGQLMPWVGAALAFVGREVMPRVATTLLDAWDRRRAARSAGASLSPAVDPRTSMPATPATTGRGVGRGGEHRRRRFRRRGR